MFVLAGGVVWWLTSGHSPAYPDELTLYSIDGPTWSLEQPSTGGEQLNGFPVLGKVEVTDERQRQEIVDAIDSAIKNANGGKTCFVPRHAIRAVTDGNVVVTVICFECGNYNLYEAQELVRSSHGISPEAQPLLDKVLTDAGVTLAPRDY